MAIALPRSRNCAIRVGKKAIALFAIVGCQGQAPAKNLPPAVDIRIDAAAAADARPSVRDGAAGDSARAVERSDAAVQPPDGRETPPATTAPHVAAVWAVGDGDTLERD